MHHHAQLLFVFLVELGFCHVGQPGLELLTAGDPPTSASQSAGITSVSHCAQPKKFFKGWIIEIDVNLFFLSICLFAVFSPHILPLHFNLLLLIHLATYWY